MSLRNIKALDWFNKPFPFYENYKQKIFIPTIITVLIIVGLIILDFPIEKEKLIEYFKYGLLISSVSVVFNLVLPEIFKKAFEYENWNIKKTLIYSVFSICTIVLFISAYIYYKATIELDFVYLFFIVLKRALILNILPITILIYIGEKYLEKKNDLKSNEINIELKKNKQQQNRSFTLLVNTKDELKLFENELLYIKAEANYCFVYYIKNKSINKKLIRSSLKNLEQSFNNSDQIVKCHRSFIVNLLKVSNVSGNARGYAFTLKDVDQLIPVSRNFSKQLIEKLKSK